MDVGAVMVGLFVLVYLCLALAALRRPLLARLAFREAVRRPWQSALLVAGLMTGTAAILSMNALIDSAIDSESFAVQLAWGRVDLEVGNGGAFFSSQVANQVAADPGVRKQIAGVQPGAELVGSVTDLDRSTVRPTAHIVGFDPTVQSQFGTFHLLDGRQTTGADLGSGGVLISQLLATSLDARPGDRLRITADGRAAEVSVFGITQTRGAGAFGLGPGLEGTVFAPLESLPPIVPAGEVNVIRLTAGGAAADEIARAHQAVPAIDEVLALTGGPLVVHEVKADDLKVAGSGPRSGRGFFTSIGMIVVIAGTLLIVNLVLALSEERRPRLAVLRALGLSRSAQVLMSVLEASVYAIAAGVIGIVPGLLLAFVMLNQLGDAIGVGQQSFQFSIQGYSLVVAVAAGTVITLATAAVASLRGSRMTIATAIKNMPERSRAARRRRWVVPVQSAVAVGAVVGIAGGQPVLRFAGGAVLVILAATVAGRRLGARPRAVVLGGAVTAWATAWVTVGPGPGPGAWPWVAWVGAVVLAAFGLATIITAGFKILETGVAAFGSARAGAALRPSLAYLSRRPIPAALGITSTAIVVGILFLAQQLATATEASILQGAGAYNVAVIAPGRPHISIPDTLLSQVAAQAHIASRVYVGSLRTYGPAANNDTTAPHRALNLYSLTDDQLAHPILAIGSRASSYSSDADVWRAMESDPTLVLTPGGVGDDIEVQAASRPVHFRSVGVVANPFLRGIVGSSAAFAPFQSLPPGQTLLIQTAKSTAVEAFARQLQKEVINDGAEVVTLQEAAAQSVAASTSFVAIFELLLTVGLVVGVSSLGIVAFRAVIERRRAIGVLRALGYQPGAVLGGMLAESLLTGASGAAVGILLGIILGYSWVTSQNVAAAAVDWSVVVRTVALILAAVVLVTIVPALQASRLAPAQALRLMD
jgi:ABC-type antimicrobial peptide transport system permease subunit